MAKSPPRNVEIKGQDHMLAYITPEEGGILQLLGGSGAPGPMGIPAYWTGSAESANAGAAAAADTAAADTSAEDGFSEDDPDNVDYSSYSPTDMDLGPGRTGNRTNISNVGLGSNLSYSPSFAAEVAIGQGLDPRGLKGFSSVPANLSFPSIPGNPSLASLGYNPSISTNPLAQIDPKSALGQKYSQALSMAPNIMGPFSKASLQGLSLAQIDKMDPASLAGLMAAANMSRNNAYGTTSVPGYMGAIAQMTGMVKGPQDISYDMSLKDAVEKSRAGLAYGTVPGQSTSNFGQISGITDQISKDFSAAGKGIASAASNAFNDVTQAVADALGFATDPYGGMHYSEFSGTMSSRDAQGTVSDYSNMNMNNDNEGGESDIEKSLPNLDSSSTTPIERAPVVGEAFIDPELLKYLKRRPAAPVSEVGYNQDLTASSSAKPVDFSNFDRGLGSLQSGITAINRNR